MESDVLERLIVCDLNAKFKNANSYSEKKVIVKGLRIFKFREFLNLKSYESICEAVYDEQSRDELYSSLVKSERYLLAVKRDDEDLRSEDIEIAYTPRNYFQRK